MSFASMTLAQKLSEMGFERVCGFPLPPATNAAAQLSERALWASYRFLLQRFDPDAFPFGNQKNTDEKSIVKALNTVELGHLVKSSSDVFTGHRPAAVALESLLGKVEQRHGSSLYNRAFQNRQDSRAQRAAASLQKENVAPARRKTLTAAPLPNSSSSSSSILYQDDDVNGDGGHDLTHTVTMGNVTLNAAALQTPLREQSPHTRRLRNAIPTGTHQLHATPVGAAQPPPMPPTARRSERRKTNMIPTGKQLVHSPIDTGVINVTSATANIAQITTTVAVVQPPVVAQPIRVAPRDPARAARNMIPSGRQLGRSPTMAIDYEPTAAVVVEPPPQAEVAQAPPTPQPQSLPQQAERPVRNVIPSGNGLARTPVAAAAPPAKRHPLAQSTPARDLPPSPMDEDQPVVQPVQPVQPVVRRNMIPTGRQLANTPVAAPVVAAPVVAAPATPSPVRAATPRSSAKKALVVTPPSSVVRAITPAPTPTPQRPTTPMSASARLRRTMKSPAARASPLRQDLTDSSIVSSVATDYDIEEARAVAPSPVAVGAAVDAASPAIVVATTPQRNIDELAHMEAMVDQLQSVVRGDDDELGGAWGDDGGFEMLSPQVSSPYVPAVVEDEPPPPPPAAAVATVAPGGMTMADLAFVEEAQRIAVAAQLEETARQIDAATRRRASLERHHSAAAEQLEATETETRKANAKLEQRVAALGESLPTDRAQLRAELARLRTEQADAARLPSTMEDVVREVTAAAAVEAGRSVALGDRARRVGAESAEETTERARKRRRAVIDDAERELELARERHQHALETIARANANIERLESERVAAVQQRAEPLPQPLVRRPAQLAAEFASLSAPVRAREMMKKRAEMYSLRVQLLRQNANMMMTMAVSN